MGLSHYVDDEKKIVYRHLIFELDELIKLS